MLCSPDILTFARMAPKPIYMAPEHLLEVPEGPGSAPEVSGMSRNGPSLSRKVLEASRRSWKVPEGSRQYHPPPAPMALGGKPPRQPWPARRGDAHQGGRILLQVGLPIPVLAGFRWEGVGSFGRLGSPSWTPKPP